MTAAPLLLANPALIRGPARLRIRPAPRREPPFDDELPILDPSWPGELHPPLPFGGARPVPIHVRAPRVEGPDPGTWARRLLVGLLEVSAGRRPLPQLAPLLSPSIAAGLRADFGRALELRRRHWTAAATVRSVRVSEPTPGVAEVSATLQSGPRVRAVALRAEAVDGQWRCTRLQLG